MLSCACLGDDAGLAHTLAQQRLPKGVVDLVRPRVVQVLPLQVDLRPRAVSPAHTQNVMEPDRDVRVGQPGQKCISRKDI